MHENLITLRAGKSGHEPVVSFVHPAGGSARAFRTLVAHLGAPCTAYAFEALTPGPDDGCSVGSVAENYWTALRRVTGPGQHIVVGWSFGGVVAVEIARLAEAEGRETRAVVLLDCATPAVSAEHRRSSLEELAALFGIPVPKTTMPTLEAALEAVTAALRHKHGLAEIDVDDLRPFVDVYEWHLRAFIGWSVRACAAPVTLVRARDETGWKGAPSDLGWATALGRPVDLRWTPGTHHTLATGDAATELARLLDSIITTETTAGVAQ